MTATILRGSLAQVLAQLMQAPRGITVKQWIELREAITPRGTRRNSGKQGG